jgi:glycosyltransferase involved in cell wall biosynthesis
VIYNTFNGKFSPLTKEAREGILSKSGVNASTPFILHVGSSLPRKNRQLLLDMVATLGDRWKGNICFAGKEIDEKLKSHAEFVGLRDRIVSIVQPSHETLVALYSACEVFVFPSFSEGFGWPVIEAQACGTPVIASKMQPMPEISGGAALHADPTKPQEFADAFLSLQDKTFRNKIIEAGTKNCLRYSEEPIIRDYLNLHNLN